MPAILTRTCPCCGKVFKPCGVATVTCRPACSKRAYRLRQKLKAHERGERNVTPAVLADARRVFDADAAMQAERFSILAERETEQAQRKAEREAEREAQRARKEAEHALLVQARENLKATRKARKAAREVGEEVDAMGERDPVVIAAKQLAAGGYCTEVLAFSIMSRRAYEQEPEEWKRQNPIWPTCRQPGDPD